MRERGPGRPETTISEMDERPPFDAVRASFYLVAGVFAVYAGLIALGAIACVWHMQVLIEKGAAECVKEGRLFEAMGSLLASALAFAAGRGVTK